MARLIVSLSVYEEPNYIRSLLNNILSTTESDTKIVVHVSKAAKWTPDDFKNLSSQNRVLINPKRVRTKHSHGSILQSQVLNVKYMLFSNITATTILFAPSNMLWCRKGIEAYVTDHKSSVPRIKNHVECKMWNSNPPHMELRRCAWSPTISRRKDIQRADPAGVFKEIRKICHPKAYVQTKHEGSYYPFAEIVRWAMLLPSSLFHKSTFAEEFVWQTCIANNNLSQFTNVTGTVMASTGMHRMTNPDVRNVDFRNVSAHCRAKAWDNRFGGLAFGLKRL